MVTKVALLLVILRKINVLKKTLIIFNRSQLSHTYKNIYDNYFCLMDNRRLKIYVFCPLKKLSHLDPCQEKRIMLEKFCTSKKNKKKQPMQQDFNRTFNPLTISHVERVKNKTTLIE